MGLLVSFSDVLISGMVRSADSPGWEDGSSDRWRGDALKEPLRGAERTRNANRFGLRRRSFLTRTELAALLRAEVTRADRLGGRRQPLLDRIGR